MGLSAGTRRRRLGRAEILEWTAVFVQRSGLRTSFMVIADH